MKNENDRYSLYDDKGTLNEENRKLHHTYWNNALANLQKFIIGKSPIAIGLQELNNTEQVDLFDDSIKKNILDYGTFAIQIMLDKLNNDTDKKYEIINKEVQSKFNSISEVAANIGISIIINTAKVGNLTHSHVQDNENQIGPVIGGRPIMIVYTDKDFLFVNTHGAQDPKKGKDRTGFNKYIKENNGNYIEKIIQKFIEDNKLSPKHYYIMGDFNDRYDALTKFNVGNVIIKYDDESPKSCCHNWDSSASSEERKIDLKDGYFTANVPENPKSIIPDEEVAIKNYLYKGDKVFSNYGGKLKTYDSLMKNGVSIASDHELVYIETNYDDSVNTGGKRRLKKQTRTKRIRRKGKRKGRTINKNKRSRKK